MKPAMWVVEMQSRCSVLVGSNELTEIGGNGGFNYGGGGDGPGRVKHRDDFGGYEARYERLRGDFDYEDGDLGYAW